MSNYEIKITAASKELSIKEKYILTHSDDALSLDKEIKSPEEPPIIINLESWALCDVHNENARGDKDYRQLILVDDAGLKYTTGSSMFLQSFPECWEAIKAARESGDSAMLTVYKRKSRNGNDFLACNIV